MQTLNAQEFHTWIKQIEADTSLKPSQIARAAGLAESTLTRYMNPDYSRAPQRRTIEKIARRFGDAAMPRSGVREDAVGFDHKLQSEAEALGLDPDAIARKAVEDAIKQKRFEAWLDENQEIFEAKAHSVDENGLWCDRYRLF